MPPTVRTVRRAAALLALLSLPPAAHGFRVARPVPLRGGVRTASPLRAAAAGPDDAATLRAGVKELKTVLTKEYTSFFSPMSTSHYAPDVTFLDPLTSLAGVAAYADNVDMLAGRTLLGKFLFRDAGIVLHSVTGGAVGADGSCGDVTTRWTLRVTVGALPWTPEAVFSGVSVYGLARGPGGGPAVIVASQADYWDSANIVAPGTAGGGGEYAAVAKTKALGDFWGQVRPGGAAAPPAGPEVPYILLRRGDGYEVRGYPAIASAKMAYERRDEAYLQLGQATRGSNPYAPAIMTVPDDADEEKYMSFPVAFAAPGQDLAIPDSIGTRIMGTPGVTLAAEKGRVVAVAGYDDASTAGLVRQRDRDLRGMLARDGLVPAPGAAGSVTFAQFDAVYTMGARRGEAWIELEGHPW